MPLLRPRSQNPHVTYGVNGRVLGPTVGAWCETSTDFDLLVMESNPLAVANPADVAANGGYSRGSRD